MRALSSLVLLLTMAACSDEPVLPYDPTPVGQAMPEVLAALQAGQPALALQRLDALAAAGRAPAGHEHFRAVALLDDGRPGEALPVLEAELGAHPGNGAAQLMLAEALLAMGRADEAPAHLTASRVSLPDSTYRLLVEGRVAVAREDDAGAREAFEAYLRSDPLSARAAEAHYALGQVARRAGESRLAEQHVERSSYLETVNQYLNAYRQRLQADPDDAEAVLGVGLTYLDLMKTLGTSASLAAQAEAALRRHVQLAPESARGYYNLGFLATLAGHPEQAFAAYARTLELDPGHVGALLNDGTLALQQGRLEQAAEHLEAGLELAGEARDKARALFQLGLLAEARQQPEQALERYRAARVLEPGDPRLAERIEALSPGSSAAGG